MMIYPLAKQGVYRTINGEGALLGEPQIFIRLAGCSVGCKRCDTNYRLHSHATAQEIAARAAESRQGASWVWITGGEPTDHDLAPLADALRAEGFQVAVATAGVRLIPPGIADWISVSPHRPGKPEQWAGHEVKLVAGLNDLRLADCDPRDYLSFAYRYVSPCAGLRQTMVECLDWIRTNPGWRLGCQAHKIWGLE